MRRRRPGVQLAPSLTGSRSGTAAIWVALCVPADLFCLRSPAKGRILCTMGGDGRRSRRQRRRRQEASPGPRSRRRHRAPAPRARQPHHPHLPAPRGQEAGEGQGRRPLRRQARQEAEEAAEGRHPLPRFLGAVPRADRRPGRGDRPRRPRRPQGALRPRDHGRGQRRALLLRRRAGPAEEQVVRAADRARHLPVRLHPDRPVLLPAGHRVAAPAPVAAAGDARRPGRHRGVPARASASTRTSSGATWTPTRRPGRRSASAS